MCKNNEYRMRKIKERQCKIFPSYYFVVVVVDSVQFCSLLFLFFFLFLSTRTGFSNWLICFSLGLHATGCIRCVGRVPWYGCCWLKLVVIYNNRLSFSFCLHCPVCLLACSITSSSSTLTFYDGTRLTNVAHFLSSVSRVFFFLLSFAFNSSKNEVHAIEANRFWWIDTLSLTGNEFHQLLFSVSVRIRSHRFAYGNMLHRSLLTDGLFPVYLFRISVFDEEFEPGIPASISYTKTISPHQRLVDVYFFLLQFSLFC